MGKQTINISETINTPVRRKRNERKELESSCGMYWTEKRFYDRFISCEKPEPHRTSEDVIHLSTTLKLMDKMYMYSMKVV